MRACPAKCWQSREFPSGARVSTANMSRAGCEFNLSKSRPLIGMGAYLIVQGLGDRLVALPPYSVPRNRVRYVLALEVQSNDSGHIPLA